MWRCYRLVFQAHSPIHIGYRRIGNIQRTRYYILGRTMWGAVSKKLTQSLGSRDYADVAEFVKENLRFGYFFPALDPERPFYPFLKEEFERLLIRSIDLTAINHFTTSAEEETLHELEFLTHLAELDGELKPLFFIGSLFLKEGATYEGKKVGWEEEIKLSEMIKELSVGGEIKYGFGKLVLDEGNKVNEFLNGYPIELGTEEPVIRVPARKPFLAHFRADGKENSEGEIEPLVGKEWEDKKGHHGAGQELSQPLVCWVPGSWAQEETEVKVGHFGIWEIGYTSSDYCKRYKEKYGMSWEEFERKMKEGEIVPPERDSLELYEWHSDIMDWEFYARANREDP